MKIKIKKLNSNAVTPTYNFRGDSGFDLSAAENYTIYPGHTVLVKTGLAFDIPEGLELQVRPRSGISLKTKLRVGNSPGTVDSSYKGEVCVIITNTAMENTGTTHIIKAGDKVAQGVICPVIRADFEEIKELTESQRGERGFGSTGL